MLLVSLSLLLEVRSNTLSILVFLPFHNLSEPTVSWERGMEIQPGVLVAMDEINADMSVLPGYNLTLIVLDSEKQDVLEQFIKRAFYDANYNIVGVSGFLVSSDVSVLSRLVRHRGILMSSFTDYATSDKEDNLPTCALHSPSVMANAIVQLMRVLDWKRIGLITQSSNDYFFRVAELLLQEAKDKTNSLSILPYIDLSHVTNSAAVNELAKLNTRVVVVSVDIIKAMQLLCLVHDLGLTWPDYAWVFHSYTITDFTEVHIESCDINEALNGIFFLDNLPPQGPPQKQLLSGITFTTYYERYLTKLMTFASTNNITFQPNPYAELMYQSTWQMAIALNECWQHHGMCKQITFDATFEFCQQLNSIVRMNYIINQSSVLLGTVYYNSSIPLVSLDMSILNNTLGNELPISVSKIPFGYTVTVGIQLALTTLFVTTMLILYVCFHHEPEIRATSFTLSLLIFAGCYMNLIYLALLYHSNRSLAIDTKADDTVCLLLLWLSAPGITLPLMLAILIVKMLRVYHIFNHVRLRLGHYCSDLALVIYVFLILVPDIVIHILWVSINRYHSLVNYKAKDGFNHVRKTCVSDNHVVWFVLLTVYLLALIFALGVIAVITRKIRLQHFKDTKKVNILLFILGLGIVITLSSWLVLLTMNPEPYIRTLPLHVGHSVMVIAFQVLLFVPKVFPPLWRRVKQ